MKRGWALEAEAAGRNPRFYAWLQVIVAVGFFLGVYFAYFYPALSELPAPPVERTLNLLGTGSLFELYGEEMVGAGLASSEINLVKVAADTKNQPHIAAGIYNFMVFHKIGSQWSSATLATKTNLPQYSVKDYGISKDIAIDSNDRMWIPVLPWPAETVSETVIARFLIESVSTSPRLAWTKYKGCGEDWNCGGSEAVDPYYKGYAFGYKNDFPLYKFDSSGGYTQLSSLSGGSGGEKEAFAITPKANGAEPGVMHWATDWSYQNSARKSKGLSKIIWSTLANHPEQGVDQDYVDVTGDLKNPEAAYIVTSRGVGYNKIVAEIYNGASMVYPDTGLKILDSNAAYFGNGAPRNSPQIAPALGGGAFACWSGADGKIKLIYMNYANSYFGTIADVAYGNKCGIATDSAGNIHLAYYNNGLKYRLIKSPYAGDGGVCTQGQIKNAGTPCISSLMWNSARTAKIPAVGACAFGTKQQTCQNSILVWSTCTIPRQGSKSEKCNGMDDNCDGVVDEGCDDDSDTLLDFEMECGGTYLKKLTGAVNVSALGNIVGTIAASSTGGGAAGSGLSVFSNYKVYFQDKNSNPIYFVGTYATSLGKGFLPGAWSYVLNRTAGKSNYIRYQVSLVDLADTYYNPNCGMLTPWKRVSGAGKTTAGLCNKFDLTKFDENYFADMKSYIAEAEKRGIYVHISLFDEVFVKPKSGLGFDRNPFGNGNHINTGLIGNVDRNSDGSGMGSNEFYDVQALKGETADSQRLALGRLQKAYVEKVINETKGFSNVFYEVGNEITAEWWNAYWVDFIKARTTRPVTINCNCLASGNQDGATSHRIGFNSGAGTISPGLSFSSFSKKLLVGMDTDGDDIAGNPDNNRKAAWLAFVLGYGLYGDYGEYMSEADFNREQMYFGYIVKFIKESGIKFGDMRPHNELCGGKACLANPGKEYVIYSTAGGSYHINLQAVPAATTFKVRWYNPLTGVFTDAGTVGGAEVKTFTPPFSGEAVLYAVKQDTASSAGITGAITNPTDQESAADAASSPSRLCTPIAPNTFQCTINKSINSTGTDGEACEESCRTALCKLSVEEIPPLCLTDTNGTAPIFTCQINTEIVRSDPSTCQSACFTKMCASVTSSTSTSGSSGSTAGSAGTTADYGTGSWDSSSADFTGTSAQAAAGNIIAYMLEADFDSDGSAETAYYYPEGKILSITCDDCRALIDFGVPGNKGCKNRDKDDSNPSTETFVSCKQDSDCALPALDDRNVCTDSVCDIARKICIQAGNNAICNDKKWCTINDYCSNGVCTGDDRVCAEDKLACSQAYCNEKQDICSFDFESCDCSKASDCSVSNDSCIEAVCESHRCKTKNLANCTARPMANATDEEDDDEEEENKRKEFTDLYELITGTKQTSQLDSGAGQASEQESGISPWAWLLPLIAAIIALAAAIYFIIRIRSPYASKVHIDSSGYHIPQKSSWEKIKDELRALFTKKPKIF